MPIKPLSTHRQGPAQMLTILKRDHLVRPVTEILMISQEMVVTLQFIFVGKTWVVFSATGSE